MENQLTKRIKSLLINQSIVINQQEKYFSSVNTYTTKLRDEGFGCKVKTMKNAEGKPYRKIITLIGYQKPTIKEMV